MSITAKKHSNVFYILEKTGSDMGFKPVEKARACKNSLGLDLFQYGAAVYEGRTGLLMMSTRGLPPGFAEHIEKNGGLQKLNENIEAQLSKTGESPRYTRPDERKQDIFPPDPEKENTVFAKGGDGKKHYYSRFYNENGIELFTLKNENEPYSTAFVQCDGYMIGIGSKTNYESIAERIAGFENGIKGEVERIVNESMDNPQKWVDMYFAEILGRVDEAKAHNAPIREARDLENQRRDEERESKRIAKEQAEKAEYEQAIKTAEGKILNKETVGNADIQGKSLIMQLFREHNIPIPLKTQGWIINALADIHYNENRERWSYTYFNSSKNSTVFSDYLPLLVSAVQTKQQFEEMTCPLDGDTENDCADCVYSGDYHFQNGECVERDDDDMEI